MKYLVLIVLFVLSPILFFAQQLSGLWTGTMSNDSTTVRKEQSFEVALSEYKGKVYGYSRSTFIVNDTLYYIVKRVKGVIQGNVCEVTDDEIITHNFRKKIDKGIKVVTTFTKNPGDTSWSMSGDWKTNQTKKYYSISGKVDLREEKNIEMSKLFPHLEELGLAKEMPFYQDSKKEDLPVYTRTTIATSHLNSVSPQAVTKAPATDIKTATVAIDRNILVEEKKTATAFKTEQVKGIVTTTTGQPEAGIKVNSVAVDRNILVEEKKTETAFKTEQVGSISNTKNSTKPVTDVKVNSVAVDRNILVEEKKTTTAIGTEQQAIKSSETAIGNSPRTGIGSANLPSINNTIITNETVGTTSPSAIVDPFAPAAFVNMRKTEAPQIINFVSDSLTLALYDNGEIDGDTVSLLLNGEILMAKQGLKATAIKKTIYITPGHEEVNLVLYAENLGKYPPNTGLLVIYDGEERYQVRFSADLSKNASIVFRRKK